MIVQDNIIANTI